MKLLVMMFIVLISTPVFSNDDIWINGKIVRIQNWQGHGGNLIKMDNMTATAGACPRNDYYILPPNHQFYQQNFSMLLSARIGDKDKCIEGFPVVIHLSL